MNYFVYIVKFLYRIKWWLILCPLAIAILVYLKMGASPRMYKSTTTIYTGIVSGYDIETVEASHQDWNIINNAMDNLINIIKSQSTLKNVSMRLYALNMVHGDPDRDNNYILARNYRDELNHTPQAVKDLIDRNDEERTLANLYAYEKADHDNHVYGLFHWTHRYYSYQALSRITVKRIGTSDMLEVSYENDDPGVVYNTLMLLNDEFVKQYHDLRFGETNNVIDYFEKALDSVGRNLKLQEDNLRDYNIEHRVINYDEQTKQVAALDRDFELNYAELMRNYKSSEALITSIEKQIEALHTIRLKNAAFIDKLQRISNLQTQIAAAEAFRFEDDAQSRPRQNIDGLKKQLTSEEKELQRITGEISAQQYTKEGIATESIVDEWLASVLLFEKSKAELDVVNARRKLLDRQYSLLSPVGSTLKRKYREIGFTEQSYLSILQALNTARLRQKNLQMSSATLKIINPPILPISAEPSKRKLFVLAAAFATFCFVLGLFILLEILDRTLRDKLRTERITGGKVIGALPGKGRFGQRRYAETYRRIASQHLANAMLNYIRPETCNIVNILSTEPGDGKSLLMELLAARLREKGMKVRTLSWNRDFDSERKEYVLAQQLSDFVTDSDDPDQPSLEEADVILIEYPAFAGTSVPAALLRTAALNIVAAPANRTWKDTDQLLYEKAVALSGATPVCFCLTCARRNVVENFTGLLPPFTSARKMGYRISQLGFTAVK